MKPAVYLDQKVNFRAYLLADRFDVGDRVVFVRLRDKCPARIAQGILNVRKGRLTITPGYDGEYGKVKVLK